MKQNELFVSNETKSSGPFRSKQTQMLSCASAKLKEFSPVTVYKSAQEHTYLKAISCQYHSHDKSQCKRWIYSFGISQVAQNLFLEEEEQKELDFIKLNTR